VLCCLLDRARLSATAPKAKGGGSRRQPTALVPTKGQPTSPALYPPPSHCARSPLLLAQPKIGHWGARILVKEGGKGRQRSAPNFLPSRPHSHLPQFRGALRLLFSMFQSPSNPNSFAFHLYSPIHPNPKPHSSSIIHSFPGTN